VQVEALLDLAEVLRLAGRDDEARSALERAQELCELKQITALVPRLEALLANLEAGDRQILLTARGVRPAASP
jgi:hypothetical protein